MSSSTINFEVTPLNASTVGARCGAAAADDRRQIYTTSLSTFLGNAGCSVATECVLKYYAYDSSNNLLSQNFFLFASPAVRAASDTEAHGHSAHRT